MSVEPSSCRHCGIPERDHMQRWTAGAGWHAWTAPTDQQRLARMTARRYAPKETPVDFRDALNTVTAELTPQPWDYTDTNGATLTVIPDGLRADPGDAEVLISITASHTLAATIGVTTADLPGLITALTSGAEWEHDGLYDETVSVARSGDGWVLTVVDALRHGTDTGPATAAIRLPEAQRLPLASALRRALDVARGWED